jgi:hypothetical protein
MNQLPGKTGISELYENLGFKLKGLVKSTRCAWNSGGQKYF